MVHCVTAEAEETSSTGQVLVAPEASSVVLSQPQQPQHAAHPRLERIQSILVVSSETGLPYRWKTSQAVGGPRAGRGVAARIRSLDDHMGDTA